MSDPYETYFRSGKDDYTLIRVKRSWIPDWFFRIAAAVDPSGSWLCQWLTTPV